MGIDSNDPFNKKTGKDLDKSPEDTAGGLTQNQQEKISQEMSVFLKEIFSENKWGEATTATELSFGILADEYKIPEKFEVNFIRPDKIDYQKNLDGEVSKSERDEQGMLKHLKYKELVKYTLNPETQSLDFEKMKPILWDSKDDKEFKKWIKENKKSETLNSAIEYVAKIKGNDFHLPGLEYAKFLYQNPDKIPNEIKDMVKTKETTFGQIKPNHFLPGSFMTNSYGGWVSPLINNGYDKKDITKEKLRVGGRPISTDFTFISYKVILLEKK